MTTVKAYIGRTFMIALAIFGMAFFALFPAVIGSLVIAGVMGLEEGSTEGAIVFGAIYAPLFVMGSIGAVQEVLREDNEPI